eukprot:2583084-Amphidinium_carterae.1
MMKTVRLLRSTDLIELFLLDARHGWSPAYHRSHPKGGRHDLPLRNMLAPTVAVHLGIESANTPRCSHRMLPLHLERVCTAPVTSEIELKLMIVCKVCFDFDSSTFGWLGSVSTRQLKGVWI